MPTLETLQLPRIDAGTAGGREAKKIASHLYQVEEQLRYVLAHLDEDNLSEELKNRIESGGMSSEVQQTLDAVTLRISGQDDALAELRVSLSGVAATVQEQGGAISTLRQTADGIAQQVADDRRQAASALQQTADSITAAVAAAYATKQELSSTVEQTVSHLRLAVQNGPTASTLTLKAGETELCSETITMNGVVTFTGLADGTTEVNGGCLRTGLIRNHAATTTYDLDAGTIRMGAESDDNIYIQKNSLVMYGRQPNGVTVPAGLLYCGADGTYLGGRSTNTYFGYMRTDTPTASDWYGMHITQGGDVTFNTRSLSIETTDSDKKGMNVGQYVSCRGVRAWEDSTLQNLQINGRLTVGGTGSKDAAVTTPFGTLLLTAAESPAPCFQDWGGGVCDDSGVCLLALDERFLAVTEPGQKKRWLLTDTCGGGPLWAEDRPFGAAVHGAPGQRFDWVCFAAQRGTGGWYAEPMAANDLIWEGTV